MADDPSSKRCPICSSPAGRAPGNRWFPFCSDRCRLIDLGKWLSGDYRIPMRGEDGEQEQPDGEDQRKH